MDERIATFPIPPNRFAQMIANKISPRTGLIINRDDEGNITEFLANVRVMSDVIDEFGKITQLANEALHEVLNTK